MVPYFSSSGHQNYTSYDTHYQQSMEKLFTKGILEHFMKEHYVMRHNPGIWNAIWSDIMYINIT